MPRKKRRLEIEFREGNWFGYYGMVMLYAKTQVQYTCWCGGWVPSPEILVWIAPNPDLFRSLFNSRRIAAETFPFEYCRTCGVFAEPLSNNEIAELRRKTVAYLEGMGVLTPWSGTLVIINQAAVSAALAERENAAEPDKEE